MHHHTWLTFVFLVKMEFCCVGQAGLELLAPSNLPTLGPQSAGIAGVSQGAQPPLLLSKCPFTLQWVDGGGIYTCDSG